MLNNARLRDSRVTRRDMSRATCDATIEVASSHVRDNASSRPSKYRSKWCGARYPDCNRHQSLKEHDRWVLLDMLQRAGHITNLREQVPFELFEAQKGERAVRMVVDFVYEKDGQLVLEDTKGMTTRDWLLKRKWLLQRYGYKVQIIK